MRELAEILPHVNASLNALATVLLVAGYVQIKLRRETAHKWTMIACFGVSCVFLACYVTAHVLKRQLTGDAHTKFSHELYGVLTYRIYATILITHIVLAATVPFFAIATIYTGLKAEHETNTAIGWRRFHRKLAWWTFPIWLYVSVTGVVVYLMLYHLYPPGPIG